MISSVPLELKSQTNFVEGKNLTPTAMPSTAYITKVSRQSSILDLSIAIQNTSTDTPIEIKIIEILLPVGQNSNNSCSFCNYFRCGRKSLGCKFWCYFWTILSNSKNRRFQYIFSW
jgi:hypothetical protein